MSEPKDFYLLGRFQSIPKEDPSTWLGKVVSDFRRPLQAYTPQKPFSPALESHPEAEFSNLSRVFDALSSHSSKASFLDLLGVSHEDWKSKRLEFAGRRVKRLRVHNDIDVLKRAVSETEVSATLEEWHTHLFSPLYLVVGVLVTDHIKYQTSKGVGHRTGGHVDPIQTGSLGAGVPIPLPSSVGHHVSHSEKQTDKAEAKGSLIFAIEYRMFRRKLVQREDKKVRLSSRRPKGDSMFGDTGAESTEPVEDVMEIQAEFDSEAFIESLEMEDEKEENCFSLASLE